MLVGMMVLALGLLGCAGDTLGNDNIVGSSAVVIIPFAILAAMLFRRG